MLLLCALQVAKSHGAVGGYRRAREVFVFSAMIHAHCADISERNGEHQMYLHWYRHLYMRMRVHYSRHMYMRKRVHYSSYRHMYVRMRLHYTPPDKVDPVCRQYQTRKVSFY